MQPGQVRILAVVLTLLTSLPVIAYLVAAATLPDADDAEPDLGVSWRADGVRITWSGPLVPHAVPLWLFALPPIVLTALGGLVYVSLFLLQPMAAGAGEVEFSLSGLPCLGWPALLIYAMLGWIRRPFALTVTHDAAWVERPFRAPQRIDLSRVEAVHPGPDAFTLHFTDGTLLKLPPPPPSEDVDMVLKEIERAQRRLLEHHIDLEEARPEQRELERLMTQRDREG